MTKYAVYDYSYVCSDGGLVVSDTEWATQAPIISPVFKTREEAWEWLKKEEEEEK